MGSRKKQTVGYHYYMTIHMGLCRGPIDKLHEIRIGDKKAWPIPYTTTEGGGWEWVNSGGDYVYTYTPPSYSTTDPGEYASYGSGDMLRIAQPELFGGVEGEGGVDGTLEPLWGGGSQPVNSRLQALVSDTIISAFRGVVTFLFDGLISSMSPYPKSWAFRVSRNRIEDICPEASEININTAVGEDPPVYIYAVNGSNVVYECLVNASWGGGINPDDIDSASFEKAACQMKEEEFGLCLLWSRQDTVQAFIQSVLNHIGAVLYTSRETGLLTLKLIRDDYTLSSIESFTTSTGILEILEDEETTADNLINEVVVSYVSPLDGESRQIRVQNIAGQQASGSIISKSVSYPGIPTAALAAKVGMRDLRAAGTVLRRLKFTMDRRGWRLHPGKVIKIAAPERNIPTLVMRVGEIEDDLQSSKITVTAVQDVFGLPLTTYFVPITPPTPVGAVAPAPADFSRFVEVGYFDLASDSQTPAETDTYGMLLAGYAGIAINFDVYTGTDAIGYDVRGTGDFCPVGTLDGTVTPADSVFTLADPVISAYGITVGDVARIEDEFVHVISYNTTTRELTVNRGCLDSIPVAHADGANIHFYERGNGPDPTIYTEGETINGRVLPRTSAGVLHPSLAALDSVTFVNRQIRPYPPGKVMFNVTSPYYSWSTLPAQEIAVSWAHRNRLTQGDTILHHGSASVTPEAGTEYTFEVLDASDDTVLHSVTGITGNSVVYGVEQWMADGLVRDLIFTLSASRDGYDSWQAYRMPVNFSAAVDTMIIGDAFTDSNGTLVSAHDPSGPTAFQWTNAPTDGTITGARATNAANLSTAFLIYMLCPIEITIIGELHAGDGAFGLTLYGNYGAGDQRSVQIAVDLTNVVVGLVKTNAAHDNSNSANFAHGKSAGVEFEVKVVLDATGYEVFVDGVSKGTSTQDSDGFTKLDRALLEVGVDSWMNSFEVRAMW